MPTISAAKQSAAMKACIQLYKNNELTDHLIPVSSNKVLEDLEDKYFSHWKKFPNEPGAGTKKKQRSYDRYFPKELYNAFPKPNETSHLYEISMKASDVNEHLTEIFESKSVFGILTCKLLPLTADFPLYLNQGKVTVSIRHVRSGVFVDSVNRLRLLRDFHVMLFRDILKTLESKSFMSYDNSNLENSYLLVPLISQGNINWNIVERFQKLEEVFIPSCIQKLNKQYFSSDWIGKVVRPWYRSKDVNYFVVSVHKNLTPMSPFPNPTYASYQDYFEQKYGLKVEKRHTFMIEAKAIGKVLKFFCGEGKGLKSSKVKETIFIPELCHNFEFPADLWMKCKLLPIVLHRLHSLLIAEKLRTSLNDFVGINSKGYLPMTEGTGSVGENDTVQSDLANGSSVQSVNSSYIVDFDYAIAYINQELSSQTLGMFLNQGKRSKDIKILKMVNPKTPEQFKLLRAITSAGAGDIFNMERVEVLGDSFLKFAISLYLMHKFPKWNEGYLTCIKGKIVSNQNLLYLASLVDLNLPGMIISHQFEPTKNWIPPLISAPKNLISVINEKSLDPRVLNKLSLRDEEIKTGKCWFDTIDSAIQMNVEAETDLSLSQYYYFVNKQLISDKVVADSVEAILGTTLQTYGIAKNFDVLRFFGIISRDELNPSAVLKEKLVHPGIHANIQNQEVDQLLKNYAVLEKNLNYKFQDRAYLLSALTHPSNPTNRITGCYQQLEFLGDAILDFLITCYIVEQNPTMNPGKLTDLRMALVNNITLGCICVRNKFHKHLLYENDALSEAIKKFDTFQRENNFDITSEIKLLRVEDESCPDLGLYVDVPKALGDVVESLIGAVFLDTNNNLEKTWEVIYKLLEVEIHKFTKDVPIQVVRQLYEYKGADPNFGEFVQKDDGFLVNVAFTCRNKRENAIGFGKNAKQAKQSAAKAALNYLLKH